MKGGYVYIMASGPFGRLYIGVTANLNRRIWEHKNGTGSIDCQRRSCFTLVHYEKFEAIEDAISREKAMKAWKRRWKTNLIAKYNSSWRDLYLELNG